MAAMNTLDELIKRLIDIRNESEENLPVRVTGCGIAEKFVSGVSFGVDDYKNLFIEIYIDDRQ